GTAPRSETSASTASATNTADSARGASPSPPKNGPSTRGWVIRVDPDPEPEAPQATNPDLSTISGVVPNRAGSHSAMSASRPAVSDPTCAASPCAIAGLRVILARYRSTRSLL